MFSKITVTIYLMLLSIIASEKIKIPETELTINYIKYGSSGKTILLLTGTLCCIQMAHLDSQLNFFGKENTIIQMDLPGFGDSLPRKRDYSSNFYETDADIVVKFMEALNIGEYLLMGFGYGANVALYVAAKDIKKIKKVVVWGGKAKITEEVLTKADKLRDPQNWTQDVLKVMKQIYEETYIEEVANKYADGLLRLKNEFGEEFFKDKLNFIEASTLVLHGSSDDHVSMEHAVYIAKNVKGRTEVIKNGTHDLQEAEEFNSIVAHFLLEEHS
ncbi:uncharacterized protein LOC126894169 [Daktulosphaira vitifoliae]|uniref:uncharacterized protein LOC126894169 n=1 Tax=Daktulosphaira vitifoliae TaxID=58002 RepID=UPI0021AA75EE|nr:uncharacterized protein LOC126894169 [Daktulosphaira vitifoliae]